MISTPSTELAQEFHIIRAHQLHYSSLLEDFRESVQFVRDTPNPALDAMPDVERRFTIGMMNRECATLLKEIDRLERRRKMQDKRVKNVLDLVNIFARR